MKMTFRARLYTWLLSGVTNNTAAIISAYSLDYALLEQLIVNASEGASVSLFLKDGTRMEFTKRGSVAERTVNSKYY